MSVGQSASKPPEATPNLEAEKAEAKELPPDLIFRNEDNPRLIFIQSKLDTLMENIRQKGILVPLNIYRESEKKYVLIDGERRWRCAKRLNMPTVPTYVLPRPGTRIEYILNMFTIHNVKEDWKLMPTALKLKEILVEMPDQSDKQIAELTGVAPATIKRCKDLLSLPQKYQKLLLKEEAKEERDVTLTEDFFLEMMRATRSIKKFEPRLYEKYTEKGLIDSFVKKLRSGNLKNITDFRKVPKLISASRQGIPPEKIEKTLERLIREPKFTIVEAYEEVAEPVFAVAGIVKRCRTLIEELHTLKRNAKQAKMSEDVVNTLKELRSSIDESLHFLLKKK
jgi:ParB/RepB/Spo0J family partition protein